MLGVPSNCQPVSDRVCILWPFIPLFETEDVCSVCGQSINILNWVEETYYKYLSRTQTAADRASHTWLTYEIRNKRATTEQSWVNQKKRKHCTCCSLSLSLRSAVYKKCISFVTFIKRHFFVVDKMVALRGWLGLCTQLTWHSHYMGSSKEIQLCGQGEREIDKKETGTKNFVSHKSIKKSKIS